MTKNSDIFEGEEEEEVDLDQYLSNDEEFTIEGEDVFSSQEDIYDPDFKKFLQSVSTATAYLPSFNIKTESYKISFSIPTSIMPLSYAVVNGFNNYETLAHIEIILHDGKWDIKPKEVNITNPVFGSNFIGKPLIKNTISSFFDPSYCPKESYKSCPHVFIPQGDPDQYKIEQLFIEGFDPIRAKTALSYYDNDIEKAREYLIIGTLDEKISGKFNKIDIRFQESPLIYLILEITENLLSILDVCCVCGKKIGCKGLKPSVCDEKMCRFSFESVGAGSNIVAEIKRDPTVVDFLISIASCAYQKNMKWIKIPLSDSQKQMLPNFFNNLPSTWSMSQYSCDQELASRISLQYFEILRLIILANHTHLITLPPDLKIRECAEETIQFFSVVNTPQKESNIRKKTQEFGQLFLFHGSTIDRWHSILHTGLQDLGNTNDQQNGGHWFGAGVYQTECSQYAIGTYTPFGENGYIQSALGKTLRILALIENAKVKELNYVTNKEYTQQDNDALTVRCIMIVKKEFNWNTVKHPPIFIPTLHDIFKYLAKKK